MNDTVDKYGTYKDYRTTILLSVLNVSNLFAIRCGCNGSINAKIRCVNYARFPKSGHIIMCLCILFYCRRIHWTTTRNSIRIILREWQACVYGTGIIIVITWSCYYCNHMIIVIMWSCVHNVFTVHINLVAQKTILSRRLKANRKVAILGEYLIFYTLFYIKSTSL